MTADRSDRNSKNDKLLNNPTLVFVFGWLTILFALLSMFTGNRLSTLQSNYQKTVNEAAESDLNAQKEVHVALAAATVDLETVKKALTKEKKKNDQLTKKIAAITKEMETVKTDLSAARKTIEALDSNTAVISSNHFHLHGSTH